MKRRAAPEDLDRQADLNSVNNFVGAALRGRPFLSNRQTTQ